MKFAATVVINFKGITTPEIVSVYADMSRKCLKGRATLYDGEKQFLGNGLLLKGRNELFGAEGLNAKYRRDISNIFISLKHQIFFLVFETISSLPYFFAEGLQFR